MRLKNTLLVILSFIIGTLNAQVFHNEWIDFSKPYFKVKVLNEGIFKIPASELLKIPNANPSNVTIIRRGEEQPLYVNDLNRNGVFDTEDYVLFYGKPNDGLQDSYLYKFPTNYPNPYKALHSDTAIYFLTLNSHPKRIVNKLSYTASPNLPFVVYDSIRSFTERYEHGERHQTYNAPIANSDYSNLEGFVANDNNINHTFRLPNHIQGIDSYLPKFESTLLPLAVQPFRSGIITQKLVTTTSDITLGIYSFGSSNNLAFLTKADIPPSGIINNTITIKGEQNSNQYSASFSYIRWKYPIKDTVLNTTFTKWEIPNTVTGSFTTRPQNSLLTAWKEENSEIEILPSNALNSFFLQNNSSSFIYLFDESKVQSLTLHPCRLRKYPFNRDSLFVIISHSHINRPFQSIQQPIYEYAKYKNSPKGGGYDTLTAFVDDLYDQFSFGEKSPLAIRRFVQYLSQGDVLPAYLFLIGKGYELTATTRQRNGVNEIDLVPTWGNPGSDNLYSTGIKQWNKATQAIPTGRLVAYGPQEVIAYLNKLKEHDESLGKEMWRKNVLHLTGGRTTGEINSFRSFGLEMAGRISGNYLGANTQVFSKTTGDAVQIFNVSEEVNKGVGLILFHGHSSPGISDINIGYVTNPAMNYNNKGRYPIIVLNGCESGNIFIERDIFYGITFGENWVVTPDKGAINFLGHSNFGFDFTLQSYTRRLYQEWFLDSSQISWSIGKILQKTNKIFTDNNNSELVIAQATQFVLQGDPSVRIFPMPLPDYKINEAQLNIGTYDNTLITSLTDSFYVSIPIQNLGSYPINQTIDITLTRTLPNGTVVNYPKQFVSNIKNETTLIVNLPLADLDFFSVGENTIEIKIDPLNLVNESDKTNNTVQFKFYIYPSGLTCLFPKEFSIQSAPILNLVAQASDLLKSNTNYLFEIDTTAYFNSSIKQSKFVSGNALASWNNLDLSKVINPLVDSTVFYWRVFFYDPNNTNNTLKAQSSFVYIPESPQGWAQHHYFQFDKNKFESISRLEAERKNVFNTQKLTVEVEIGSQQVFARHPFSVKINNKNVINSPCGYKDQGYDPGDFGIYLASFNKNTLELYDFEPVVKPSMFKANGFGTNRGFCLENASSFSRVHAYAFNFWFEQGYDVYPTYDETKLFLQDYFSKLSEGDIVLLFTTGQPKLNLWPTDILDIFSEHLKTDFLKTIKDKGQYIYLGRKNLGPIQEVFTDTLNTDPNYTTIILKDSVELGTNSGRIISGLIGPSESWGSFFRKVNPMVENGKDWSFDVVGLDLQQNETELIKGIKATAFDLSSIDANQYPYLKLIGNFIDTLNFNPPQLESWIVTYDNLTPEGTLVLNDNGGQYSNVPLLQEGSTYSVPFYFQNISSTPFKAPLIVEYTIRNTTSGQVITKRDTLNQTLQPGQTLPLTPIISTMNLVGNNTFQIFVNPRLQKEQNYLNNLWTTRFNVFSDKENPILALTFDKRRILNREIISPNALVELHIKDENPYKRKIDTTGVVFLIKKNCLACEYQKISLKAHQYQISFSPNNITSISFHLDELEDGVYTLCVEGTDASNNPSGTRPYCIEFTVANEPAVTHFIPVPNPFTDELRFAFQLNGKRIPDEVSVLIFNTTGQLVRTLTINDLGIPIIGNNLTKAWDGKDQTGNYLSSGLYYFKSLVKTQGQVVPHLSSDADSKMNNGYGKIVLIR